MLHGSAVKQSADRAWYFRAPSFHQAEDARAGRRHRPTQLRAPKKIGTGFDVDPFDCCHVAARRCATSRPASFAHGSRSKAKGSSVNLPEHFIQ
jgi:hypothetical protein